MPFFKKIIFTGFAPNLTGRKVALSLSYLFLPWRWRKLRRGKWIKKCENYLKKQCNSDSARLVDSGRTALGIALKAVGVGPGDEVLVSGYTCQVVVNSITNLGATPVFIDINSQTLHINFKKIRENINERSKAIVVQHTFGLPVNVPQLRREINKYSKNIKIIEDCAHAFGAKFDGRLVGTWGDIGMFSFGANKVLSCVRGGALITDDKIISAKIDELIARLPDTVRFKVIQHLFYYPVFYFGRKTYGLFKFGKLLLFLARKLRITPALISSAEKLGKNSLYYPSKIPNCLARLLYDELTGISGNLSHRTKIARFYEDNLSENVRKLSPAYDERIYWYYTVGVKNIKKAELKFKNMGVIIGTDWSRSNIVPKSKLRERIYKSGSCPAAEKIAKQIINLPTNRNVSLKDAKYIIACLNSLYD